MSEIREPLPPADVAQLLEQVRAAGGPEVIFDAGLSRAIELGYVAERDGMVRLLPQGREAMRAAGERVGVPLPAANPDTDLIGLAMTAWLLELVRDAG